MSKNETSKSKAELYREERKARIAKAAKQNSKNSEKRKTAVKALKITVSIVLVLAFVAVIAGNAIVTAVGSFAPALKIADTKVSATEFNYYYMAAYSQVANQAAQYEQMYGSNVLGFDSSLPPDEQETTDAEGNKITWAESLKNTAIDFAQQTIGYYSEAVAAGMTLTEDQEAEINETIESYRHTAQDSDLSLNAYLKQSFGSGFNEKLFRKMIETEILSNAFRESKENETRESVTDEAITEEYKANQKDYDYTDIRYYTISFKKLTAKDGESEDALKKRQTEANDKLIADAKDILAKSTDEKAFIEAVKKYNESKTDTTKKSVAATYSSLKASISEDGAEWAYNADRKAGDATVITGESSAYIIFCIKPAYASNSVSIRHCLVAFNAEDSANVTDAEKKEAYKKADALLKGLGDKFTEKDFSKMVTENTEDEASASTGGLYDNIRISDSYVENFETWSFDSARKAGDTGIVETEYGYHIMYFVSDNTDDLDWKHSIRETKASEELTKYQEKLFADDSKYTVVENEFWTNFIVDKKCDLIRSSIAQSQMY